MDPVRACEEDTLYASVQHERISKLRRADHVPRNGRAGGEAPQAVRQLAGQCHALDLRPGLWHSAAAGIRIRTRQIATALFGQNSCRGRMVSNSARQASLKSLRRSIDPLLIMS